MMSPKDRVLAAYEEHGEDVVLADPELRAIIDADPDLKETFAALAGVDTALRELPTLPMPRALADEIVRRTEARTFWQWLIALLPTPDASLSFAALALILMPPFMLWMLVERRGGEAQILELVPSTVSFDMGRALDLQNRDGEIDAGEIHAVSETPATVIVPRAKKPRALDDARVALAKKQPVHVQSLVNAFSYGAATAGPRLEVEVGESPWRRETQLVRIYVATDTPLKDAKVTVAWNGARVSGYRRLADAGSSEAQAGAMAAGDAFTALYEVVTVPGIGDAAKEPLAVATLQHAGGTLRREAAANERPSQDFRFASAVAYFAMETKGTGGPWDRIAALAARSINGHPERRELLSLIHFVSKGSPK